jgi:hypothetical protein
VNPDKIIENDTEWIARVSMVVRKDFSQRLRHYIKNRKFGKSTKFHFIYAEFEESFRNSKAYVY